jgi:hypothetical protein
VPPFCVSRFYPAPPSWRRQLRLRHSWRSLSTKFQRRPHRHVPAPASPLYSPARPKKFGGAAHAAIQNIGPVPPPGSPRTTMGHARGLRHGSVTVKNTAQPRTQQRAPCGGVPDDRRARPRRREGKVCDALHLVNGAARARRGCARRSQRQPETTSRPPIPSCIPSPTSACRPVRCRCGFTGFTASLGFAGASSHSGRRSS